MATRPETVQQRAAALVKADAAKRALYAKRLKTRLAGMTTAGQIWRAAYLAGYRACYARWLRGMRHDPRRQRFVA